MEQPSQELAVEQNNLLTDPDDEVMAGDEEELQDTQQNVTNWSGWTVQVTNRMRESQIQCTQGIISYQADAYESNKVYCDAMHKDVCTLQHAMDNPIAFMSQADGDTMYFDQAMWAPDRNEFVKACIKEVNDQYNTTQGLK